MDNVFMENKTDNENNWKKYTLVAILLIIVLLFQVNSYKRKFVDLERQINGINRQFYSLEQNLNYSINRIEDHLSQSLSDVISHEIDYENIDTGAKTVDVQISFETKEVDPEAKYYVLYSPIEESKDTEIAANILHGTRFHSNFTLSYMNNYSFKIIEKAKDGGIRRLNHDDIYLYIYDDLFRYKTTINSSEISESNTHIAYGFSVINKTFGLDDLAIDKVELSLYYQGFLVYNEDITNNNDRNMMNLNTNNNSTSSFGYSTSDHLIKEDKEDEIEIKYFYAKIVKEELREAYPDFFNKGDNNLNSKLDSIIVVTMKSGQKVTLS